MRRASYRANTPKMDILIAIRRDFTHVLDRSVDRLYAATARARKQLIISQDVTVRHSLLMLW